MNVAHENQVSELRTGRYKICIVVPCFNEEEKLIPDRFLDFAAHHAGIHYCFVNDGSSDRTIDILNELKVGLQGRMLIVDLANNAGKGEAVRNGVLEAIRKGPYDFIGYFDADLATPLEEVSGMLADFVRNPNLQVVLGSRILRMGSDIRRSAVRHYFGRVAATYASMQLGLPVYDTQCGAKLMRAGLAKEIFSEPFLTRWLFDVEILFRLLQRFGRDEVLHIVSERPLNEWKEQQGSKIRIRDIILLPYNFFLIKRKYTH